MVAMGICNNTTIVISVLLEFSTRLTFASGEPLGEHKIGLLSNYFSSRLEGGSRTPKSGSLSRIFAIVRRTLIFSNVFNEVVMNNCRSISYQAVKPF